MDTLVQISKATFNTVEKLIKAFMIVILAIMSVLIVYQVVCRYIFKIL